MPARCPDTLWLTPPRRNAPRCQSECGPHHDVEAVSDSVRSRRRTDTVTLSGTTPGGLTPIRDGPRAGAGLPVGYPRPMRVLVRLCTSVLLLASVAQPAFADEIVVDDASTGVVINRE